MKDIREQYQVASTSSRSKGLMYRVTEYTDGTWACACPSWTLNKNRPDCKHILSIKLKRMQDMVKTAQKEAVYYEPKKPETATKTTTRKFKL